jgi:hypothetical protein
MGEVEFKSITRVGSGDFGVGMVLKTNLEII